MKFPNKEELKNLCEKYPVGTKVKLINMEEPYSPVPRGTIGEVMYVDDAGTIHIKWKNGSRLGLIDGVDDFVVIL